MDLLTHTLSYCFRSRRAKIDEYAQNIDIIQRRQLTELISKAKETEWGKKYDFRSIDSYNDFSRRIPLQKYDDIKPLAERMMRGEKNILWPSSVKWFAKSSGTTNDKSKFIPVTGDILKQCHYRGAFDTVALYLRNNPQSRFFAHKGLILGGSHSPSSPNSRVNCGDLSAVLIQNLSPLVDLIRVPEKKIILMGEWESKLAALVDATIKADVNNLSGVPSWMLVFIKAIMKKAGASTLIEVWPNLEVFFHGGISFAPYREQYEALIPSAKMNYMETYNASEGFFGIQDDPTDKSLLLMLDYGIYYEFIPIEDIDKENPRVIPLEEVEKGKNYAMVISTVGGLWRYIIGDTVRFTSIAPHKFVISGRTKSYINAFGEELMVDNAEHAISDICRRTHAIIKDYTVAPFFMLDKAKGRHQWMIEFEQTPDVSMETFATMLDNRLQELNSDYEAKRYKDISLQKLEIVIAPKGTFYEWLRNKGKLGGQHKIPRLANDRKIIEELLAINQ